MLWTIHNHRFTMNPERRNVDLLSGITLQHIWTIDGNRIQNVVPPADVNPPSCNTASAKPLKQLKRQINGNLVVLSAAFLVYFIGISALSTIQISIHIDEYLRETTLCVHTATMILQALFFNSLFIEHLGIKRSILVGIALEILFVGANMHTRWWTLIPAASVAGMGRILMRTSALVYIADLTDIYTSSFKKTDIGRAKWRFFSVFFIVCSSAGVIGTIILSLLFLDTGLEKLSLSHLRTTAVTHHLVNSSVEFQFCGSSFCDRNENSTLLIIDALHDYEEMHFKHVHELCGFSLGCLLFSSLIILLFLQAKNTMSPENVTDKSQPSTSDHRIDWHHLLDTMSTWRNPKQILLIPIMLYNGVDNSFFAKDFAKAFVTCFFGKQITGFAIAWFGFTVLIAVFVFSLLLSKCRQMPPAVAFASHLVGLASIFSITATNYDVKKMFTLTVTLGIGCGLWPFCIVAFIAVVFAKQTNAAFSNYSLFNTLGATMNYAWSYHLCSGAKLNIILSLLIVGFAGYLAAELLLKHGRKKTAKESNGSAP